MRKIEQAICEAIRRRVTYTVGNTAVESNGRHTRVFLHGNLIATITWSTNGTMIESIAITTAGWCTATTRSRLDAIVSYVWPHAHVNIVDGQMVARLGAQITHFDGTFGALYQEGHGGVKLSPDMADMHV